MFNIKPDLKVCLFDVTRVCFFKEGKKLILLFTVMVRDISLMPLCILTKLFHFVSLLFEWVHIQH